MNSVTSSRALDMLQKDPFMIIGKHRLGNACGFGLISWDNARCRCRSSGSRDEESAVSSELGVVV